MSIDASYADPNLAPYTSQAEMAGHHTSSLTAKVTALALGLGSVRAVAGGAGADFQRMSSGMAAAASITHQSTQQLGSSVRQLQRDFPMATQEALATVQAVQSLGLTAKDQVGQVSALSNVMVRLAGATGEANKAQLAMSFGQLNREMASLDPDRVRRFGDSLTTLAARSGASAQGIVNFAQAISPFAQQAGVGETALLGISTAFSKLGNDGYVAANTVNTMFSDLTRSVREGGNQMTAYANILGVTTNQFERLYKANPASAIAQVTQRIGTAGPAGTRMLESIGIEGIRGQRALLLAAQSGGLPAEIRRAERAYGSGSTDAAASVAYANVSDSLQRLQSASTQVAEAFERPLLHSVGRIVDAASVIPRSVAGVVGASPIQHVLGATGYLAGPLLMASVMRRVLGIGATGMFLGGSGPVRGFLGGVGLGRAGGDLDTAMSRGGLLTRAGMPFYTAIGNNDPLGSRMMAGINARALAAGAQLGGFMGPGALGGEGLRGVIRTAGATGVAGMGMYFRTHAELARLARMDPIERDAYRMRGYGPHFDNYASRQAGITAAHAAGTITMGEQASASAQNMRMLIQELKAGGVAVGGLGQAARGAGSVLFQYGRLAGSVAGSAMPAMAAGLLRTLGPTVLIGGAIGAYQGYRARQEMTSAETSRWSSLDMYGAINRYRDALGQAGEAATDLAAKFQSAATTVSKTEGTTYAGASTVSQRDIAATGQIVGSYDKGNNAVKNWFMRSSSNRTIAGQISSLNLSGLSAQDLQSTKMDLLKQGFTPDRVNQILAQVDTSGTGAFTGTGLSSSVSAITHAAATYSLSAAEKLRSPTQGRTSGRAWELIGKGGLQGSGVFVGNEGKEMLDRLQGGIQQQYADLTNQYGQGYAVQRELSTSQRALRQAIRQGNPTAVAAIAQRFSFAMTGKRVNISAADVRDAGGDLSQILDDRGLGVHGHSMAYWADRNRMRAQNVQSGDFVALRSSGASALMPYFDAQGRGLYGESEHRTAAIVRRAAERPDDLAAQTKATMHLVDSATRAGTSLAEVAHQATRSASAFADNSQQQQLMARVVAETQFRMTTNLQGATRAESWQQRTQFALGQVNTMGNSQYAQGQRQQGREQLQTVRGEQISYYQQRLQAQFQFQLQSERSQQDYQRQVDRSEQDFFINRQRAYQDYNIQLQREREDAAKTLYDPYTRIQVQAVWDAPNLIGNQSEQISAMRQQLRNITRLRELGLDEQAIQQLSLYDPNKAQQVQELVDDLSGHRGEARQLNRQAATREQLAGKMLSEDPQFKRQREDFNRNMSRQNADFQRMTDRAHTDFLIGQRRMAEDVHNQDLEMTNDLKTLQSGMNDVLHGQFVDFSNIVERTMRHTLHVVNRDGPKIRHGLASASGGGGGGHSGTAAAGAADVGIQATGGHHGGGYGDVAVGGTTGTVGQINTPGMHSTVGSTDSVSPSKYVRPGTGTVYKGKTTDEELPSWKFRNAHPPDAHFNMSIAKRMKPEWARKYWNDWYQLWQGESGWSQYAYDPDDPKHYGQGAYGIPQSYPGHKMSTAGNDWKTNPATQIKWGIDYISRTYGDPHKAWAFKQAHPKGYAAGGIATGPHIGMVAEAGSPEAMIPLNEAGVGFLARALREYLTSSDSTMLSGGGGRAYALHIDNSVHHYDQGQHIHGDVTVKADTPAEWAKQADADRRRRNLTTPRGVAWSR